MSPQHHPSIDRRRRRLLATSGAALASALTAGCLSSLPPLGGNQRYGRLDVPPSADPAYRTWLPTPTEPDSSTEAYSFVALQSTDPQPAAPEEFIARRAYSKADVDYFGVGFENYDRLLDSNFGTVVEATFDRAHVVQTVVDSGYEHTGVYRGYETFARTDVSRRVAVGDGVIVWTSAHIHERPNLESLIDTGAGRRPRHHEENARFDRLTTAAGGNAHLIVSTGVHGPTGRPAMLADAFRFDQDAAYQVVCYHYEEDRVPTRQALEDGLRAGRFRFAAAADTFDVRMDGQLATVEARIPLGSNGESSPRLDLPQVTWGVEHDADRAHVTFRHEAGESVAASRLYYDVDRPDDAGEVEKQPLWSHTDTVSPGAEATADLSEHPNAEGVSLVYSTGGTHFHVLFDVDLTGETDG